MRRISKLTLLLLLVLLALLIGTYLTFEAKLEPTVNMPQAHAATAATDASLHYKYYVLKQAQGFVLARAPKGANGEPLSKPEPLSLIAKGFGELGSDNVNSLQLSPDGRYLAISGEQDHGEMLWMYDTQNKQISLMPAHVMGNFLHWLPNGHAFLYRPMFPLDPQAPMDGNSWNPGLWLVDAASGTHTNIAIGMPSAYLADAAASPDGTRIVYSTTQGIGLGSDTWLIRADGSARTHLFYSANGQAIAGLFSWSSDGKQIAYERIADSSKPYQQAGLWVMNSQGGQQRRIADADGGHGYMPVWSPDNQKLAFIVRTNPTEALADTKAQALQAGIRVVHVRSKSSILVASARQTGVQLNTNPTWSGDSASITFTAQNPTNRVLGGSPRYYSAQLPTTFDGSLHTYAQAPVKIKPLTENITHVIAVS